MIDARDISFSYFGPQSRNKVLKELSFHINKGEFVAILGHNGSGKSSLVRHFNCLLPLQSGELKVAGLDAGDEKNIWEIRRRCGMVFQNPDNQFVSSLAEEDIAFGLRNYDVPEEDIPDIVAGALEAVGLKGFEKRAPQFLSGGQKQRLAIAGVLALEPEIIILDEASSMLDGQGRKELAEAVEGLRKRGKTIIMISHYAAEAAGADRILILKDGRLAADGKPGEILSDRELLREAGMSPPLPVRVYYTLKAEGLTLSRCPLNDEDLAEEVWAYLSKT